MGTAPKELQGSLAWGHPWSHLWEELSLARLRPSQKEERRPGAGSQEKGKFASAHSSTTPPTSASPRPFPAGRPVFCGQRPFTVGKEEDGFLLI